MKTQTTRRNAMAARLMKMPNLPRDQRRAGRGPRRRRRTMHVNLLCNRVVSECSEVKFVVYEDARDDICAEDARGGH